MKKFRIDNVKSLQLFQLIKYGSLLSIGILFSKSQLGKTDIGLYETFLLIAGAFTFFWVNGFLKVMLPVSAEKDETNKRVLVFNTFLLLLLFSAFAAILVLFLNQPFSALLLNGTKVPMPILLAFYIFINSPALMIEYIYLINNRSKSILIYAVLTFALQIAVVGLPPFFGHGLSTILLGLVAVSGLRFIWLLVVLLRYSQFEFRWTIMREYLKLGWPLVLSTLLSSSARYIDGFIITSRFSPEDFAVFQYGARELPLAMLLANSLSMATLPRLSQANIASPLAEFRSEVYRLNWMLFPISILLLLTSHWFYPIVFSAQFAASATIFNVYLLLVISRLLFPQTLLMARKMNNIIVRASFFEIVINVSLSILLAKYIGLTGVAYATFIAYMFEKIYLAIACKRKLNISIKEYLPLQVYFTMSIILVLTFVFVEFMLY
ncbi:MAG: oligosaccharide flippase family protein [Prolixibacteraceae bacterium]